MSRLWLIASVILFAVSILLSAQTATTLEMRLAESEPAAGLTEAPVSGTRQKIYLHSEAIVTGDDVVRARVVSGPGGYSFNVAVTFSRAGSEKMAKATSGHLNKPLAILVDGEVVAAPVLEDPISTSAVITGNFQNDRAEAIASGLSAR